MELDNRQKKVVESEAPHILCLASGGAGKALPNSTMIPTAQGWKRVGEIKSGDYLFDRYGKPTKVLKIFPQGELEVYELTFGDKRKAKCSEDHIWAVHKDTWKDKNAFREYTVKQLLEIGLQRTDKRGEHSSIWHIPCAKAIEKPEQIYDIDPYVMGCFLGDGSCLEDDLVISSQDEELVSEIAKLLKAKSYSKWSNSNFSWQFECEPYINENNQFVKYLKTKKVFEQYKNNIIQYSHKKSIPLIYKNGSIEQRLALLQGLFDTDGSISSNGGRYNIKFTSTSEQLTLDVKEVLGSLGYVSTLTIDKRKEKYTTGICYGLDVNIPNAEKHKLFRLSRKKEIALSCKDKKQNRNYDRTTILSIQDLGYKEEMTCFLVDNNEHLFLMNDFIVTHNTRTLTERIKHLIKDKKVKPEGIVAICFTNLAAEEMKKRLAEDGYGVWIGTIHSYANYICLKNGLDTQKFVDSYDFDKIIERAMTLRRSSFDKIEYLLVDECQDLSELEVKFLRYLPAARDFYVGDDRQAIYGFKGCSDEYLREMVDNPEYTKYYLTTNYRCAPNIIKKANSYLYSYDALSPTPQAKKTKDGLVEECTLFEALEDLEDNGNWGAWFIIARTNLEVDKIMEILDSKEIPNVTFKKGDLDSIELEELLAENRVKVLTIHSAKGLEAPKVILCGARIYNEEERKIAYVGATRAEQALYICPAVVHRGKGKRPLTSKTEAGNIFGKTSQKMIKF